MELRELILAVKDGSLEKEQLEAYRDQLVNLFAQMQLEMADLEKEEALFMNSKSNEQSVIDRKWEWKASEKGQRLLVLKRYATATSKLIDSLKNRIYEKI